MLLLRILSRILAPSESASTQNGWHSPRPRWHSSGNRARRLVVGARRGRAQAGHRGRDGRGRWRMMVLPVKALKVGEQSQPQWISLVEALHRDQVAANLGRALPPTDRVIIHRQFRAVVSFRPCEKNCAEDYRAIDLSFNCNQGSGEGEGGEVGWIRRIRHPA